MHMSASIWILHTEIEHNRRPMAIRLGSWAMNESIELIGQLLYVNYTKHCCSISLPWPRFHIHRLFALYITRSLFRPLSLFIWIIFATNIINSVVNIANGVRISRDKLTINIKATTFLWKFFHIYGLWLHNRAKPSAESEWMSEWRNEQTKRRSVFIVVTVVANSLLQ